MDEFDSAIAIYKLIIITQSGGNWEILGPKHDLDPVFQDWMENGSLTEGRLTVRGFSDSADRKPIQICQDREHIVTMALLFWG